MTGDRDHLEREVEQTRERLADTVDELTERLDPRVQARRAAASRRVRLGAVVVAALVAVVVVRRLRG